MTISNKTTNKLTYSQFSKSHKLKSTGKYRLINGQIKH